MRGSGAQPRHYPFLTTTFASISICHLGFPPCFSSLMGRSPAPIRRDAAPVPRSGAADSRLQSPAQRFGPWTARDVLRLVARAAARKRSESAQSGSYRDRAALVATAMRCAGCCRGRGLLAARKPPKHRPLRRLQTNRLVRHTDCRASTAAVIKPRCPQPLTANGRMCPFPVNESVNGPLQEPRLKQEAIRSRRADRHHTRNGAAAHASRAQERTHALGWARRS
jgi:hypothetical protein